MMVVLQNVLNIFGKLKVTKVYIIIYVGFWSGVESCIIYYMVGCAA